MSSRSVPPSHSSPVISPGVLSTWDPPAEGRREEGLTISKRSSPWEAYQQNTIGQEAASLQFWRALVQRERLLGLAPVPQEPLLSHCCLTVQGLGLDLSIPGTCTKPSSCALCPSYSPQCHPACFSHSENIPVVSTLVCLPFSSQVE